MRNLYVCAALGALLLSPLPASATIIIDDFETGTVSLAAGFSEDPAAGAIGGVRYAVASGSSTISLTTGLGDDAIDVFTDSLSINGTSLWWDGADNNNNNSNALGGIDLTEGGINDRFLLNFSSVTDDIWVQMYIIDASSGADRGHSLVLLTPGTTSLEILFSSMVFGSGSLTNVGTVALRTSTSSSGTPSGTSSGPGEFSLSRIAAVPEPSTGLLLALGLGGLALRSRRNHCRRPLSVYSDCQNASAPAGGFSFLAYWSLPIHKI